jgi:predicted DNA-binding antitoxin AbrB/MazE fold protein
MAKVMLKEGMQLELIIKITGLTKAEINKLT